MPQSGLIRVRQLACVRRRLPEELCQLETHVASGGKVLWTMDESWINKKLPRGGNPLNIIQHTGAPSYPDSVQAVRWRKDGTSRKPQDAVER